jgi:glucan 1,3-beta-glucosidase
VTIIAAWWWLGQPLSIPPSPLNPGEKLNCISYAPFHGSQTPLDLKTHIEPAQIDQDLAELAQITGCVRTYSVDFGLDKVPEIARRHGLKVMLGLWVSSHIDRTQYQLTTGVALAKQFPDVVSAVIVGNEALLRGEVSPETLGDYIRDVKSQITAPVSYADVWEFWLRYGGLASAVDFVTIHILPYWEDNPVAARDAANHVDAIRRRVAAEFASKEVMIGEVGWPSAGRMRQGALPSPANQVRVLTEVLSRGKQEHFRVNIIEAYDQPWKRVLEGTVGGHWGLFDDERDRKFAWGTPISNHPYWRWQAAAGLILAALVFTAAWIARRRDLSAPVYVAVAIDAAVAGTLAPWGVETIPVESLAIGGWLRSLAFGTLGIVVPLTVAAAAAAAIPMPTFAQIIGPRTDRVRHPLALAVGILLLALTVMALQASLALAFDPRYRDFPFAPLTAAAVPFLLMRYCAPRKDTGENAEKISAAVLALSAAFVVWNETPANWQALWFGAAIALVSLTLAPGRAARD